MQHVFHKFETFLAKYFSKRLTHTLVQQQQAICIMTHENDF